MCVLQEPKIVQAHENQQMTLLCGKFDVMRDVGMVFVRRVLKLGASKLQDCDET